MRPRLTFLAAAAASLALVVTGCSEEANNSGDEQQGGSGNGQSQQPGAQGQGKQAGTQWIDGFCGSMGNFAQAMQGTQPPNSQDPSAVKQAMSQMLGNMTQGATKLVSDMDSMKPSPINGGDKLVTGVKQSYGQLLDSAKQAKTKVDSAPESNPQATMQAVQSASGELGKIDLQKPFKELQSNKELAGAAQQAPKCQQLAQAAAQQQQQQQQQQQGGGQQPAPGN
ncbi:MAG: hypothetical protein GEU98_11530 [Pseudonocardiaceae bacterium]|nr:hypothetical protein [Pseudonocardiaceae bacterium]